MSVDTSIVTGVDFVCVPTQDIAASMDFYGQVLGLPPGGEEPQLTDPCAGPM